MKSNDFVNDIRSISEKVSIINEETYKILNKEFSVTYQQTYMKWHQPLISFGQNSGDESQKRSILQTQLASSIYSQFYCIGTTESDSLHYGNSLGGMPLQADREKTIKTLSDANHTENGTDPLWTVYSIDAHGTTFVHKNGILRYLIPNEWEIFNKVETNLKVGSVVNLKIVKEDTTIQPVFYHAKSAELINQQAEFTRIYFNTNFDGAIILVKEITSVFNKYKVPFLFKCLNHPNLFNRTDCAVLYLDKADFRFGSSLLRLILPKVQPFLKIKVPLFTCMLLPGVAFSEDPGNGQSFGMSRCSLLAEGLINAFYKYLGKSDDKLSEVSATFKKNGIDIEKIYLKPNSMFPYDFSVLTTTHSLLHGQNN